MPRLLLAASLTLAPLLAQAHEARAQEIRTREASIQETAVREAMAPVPLALVIHPLAPAPSRLDLLFERQEASARRVLAAVCTGCGLPDGDGEMPGTAIPVLPPLPEPGR